MSLTLAIDIGTSSVRAALYDERANVLPPTVVKNSRLLNTTHEGGAEIDAEEALQQVAQAIDDVLKKSKNIKDEIEFVAISCFWHSLLGIDKQGRPTTKVFGWAENRAAKYVSKLREKLDETKIHNRTGARFHSSYWTAKLLWLRKDFPEDFARTAKWLSFSDFVALKLFGYARQTEKSRQDAGVPFTSVSMASGTGIFDLRKCAWDEELLRFLRIKKENLPRIAAIDEETFSLNKKFARRFPSLRNSRWFLAIGDGAANNVGAGCVEKNKAALMIGTSGAMRVAYKGEPPKKIPSGLWCYRIDRSRVIIGGALSDGGGLYRWLKDTLKLKGTDDEIENEIAKRAPDSHGLTFLPFLAGERSTGWNENAHGAIIGLTSATTSSEIVQAALESVAYRFAEIFEQLRKVVPIEKIIASGGALRESPVWTQIIADVLGENLSLPETREASSRGAVLLALEATGKIRDLSKAETPKGRMFRANRRRFGSYLKARERQAKIHSEIFETKRGWK